MKSIKAERKPDPSGSGKMIEDFWGPSQKLLGDLKFLDSLKSYDRDNIPQAVMKKIRDKYVVMLTLSRCGTCLYNVQKWMLRPLTVPLKCNVSLASLHSCK